MIEENLFTFLPCLEFSPGTAPLTAVQLLWVNLIMDTLGALALATEPPYDELMTKAPVGRHGNFISMVMWRNIIGQAVYQLMVLSILQYKGKAILGLEGEGSTILLNTMIFNAFVFCQVCFLLFHAPHPSTSGFYAFVKSRAAKVTHTCLFSLYPH